MVKVTLGENLVPCRDLWVKGNPYSDLTCNFFHARKLIRAASFYFQLKQGSAVFSGYICEQADGFFLFKVFEQGVPVRTMIVGCLGYAGELTIDVEDLKEATGFDMLGSIAFDSAAHLAISA